MISINLKPIMEQIYIHATPLIVDDWTVVYSVTLPVALRISTIGVQVITVHNEDRGVQVNGASGRSRLRSVCADLELRNDFDNGRCCVPDELALI